MRSLHLLSTDRSPFSVNQKSDSSILIDESVEEIINVITDGMPYSVNKGNLYLYTNQNINKKNS